MVSFGLTHWGKIPHQEFRLIDAPSSIVALASNKLLDLAGRFV